MKKSLLKYLPKLDTTVFLTFGGILLLGLAFLVYQLTHRTDCTEAKYVVHADDFIIKNLIEFIDNTKGATSWKWDFGDGSAVDYNQNALHSYNKAGQYIVTLTINNTCSFQKIVTITDPDADSGYLPVIIAPNVAFEGDTIKFNARKEGGISFEWSFGEGAGTDALGEKVTYSFKTTGKKTVSLIVNGDIEHIATKTIYIAPKHIAAKKKSDVSSYEFEKPHSDFELPRGKVQKDPLVDFIGHLPVTPAPQKEKDSIPSPKKAPDISVEQFQLLLGQVAAQSKTKDDFKEYLCGNFSTPVVVNDQKLVPFEQLCRDIAGKKIKISTMRLQKDTKNCIQHIYIYYKIKKWGIWVKE